MSCGPPDPRLVQVGRLLNLHAVPDVAEARAAIEGRIGDFAAALAAEAAASDDVTGVESALAYLELRIRQLEDVMPGASLPALREAFARATAGW